MKSINLIVCLLLLATPLFAQQEEPLRIEGHAQGTTYHITYYDSLHRNLQPQIEKILHDFDQSLSTYIPTSIISRINANDQHVTVDHYFITCFNKAKEVWKNTGGAFDPTVFSLVNAWGFGPGKKEKMEKHKVDSLLKFTGFQLIELKGNKIIKKDPRVALDFNAFAQGYSVDVVAEFLNSQHISSYLVEIGGEVFANNKKPSGDFWEVGIETPNDNPDSPNNLRAIARLEHLAIATSGNYRKFFIENGIKYSHHIDPKTGYPAKNNLLSASIFAADCISSDANATGILVMGLEKAKLFLKDHPELQAYLVYSDEKGNYQVYETPGLKAIVKDIQE